MNKDSKIALYGATGFTGRLIAGLLAKDGWSFRLAGRSEERLKELAEELQETWGVSVEVAVAAVEEEHELDAMLSGVDLLINAAGPFSEIGKPLVNAALRTNTHYLDTTGEQSHIRWVEQQHEEGRKRGLILMPACAFEFALGDLAAEIAWTNAASRIVVAYVLDNMKFSQGTKKSIVRAFSENGVTFLDGGHVEKKVGYTLFDVPLPDGGSKKGAWVPGGEAITVPRRGGVSRVETCLVVGEGTAYLAATISGILPSLLRVVRPMADRMVEQSSGDPHDGGDENLEFLVVAFDPKTSLPYATLRGEDIYRTTAKIAVEAARRVLTLDLPKRGFVGAADLFDVPEFLEAIGVEIVAAK